jgi:hypothetical protein
MKAPPKYPFIRSALFHQRLLTSLDCSLVRHAQIGIIDQAVHLSVSVKTYGETAEICLPTSHTLYCEQAYHFHLQGPQFRRRRHSTRISLSPWTDWRTAPTFEPAIQPTL